MKAEWRKWAEIGRFLLGSFASRRKMKYRGAHIWHPRWVGWGVPLSPGRKDILHRRGVNDTILADSLGPRTSPQLPSKAISGIFPKWAGNFRFPRRHWAPSPAGRERQLKSDFFFWGKKNPRDDQSINLEGNCALLILFRKKCYFPILVFFFLPL